MYEVVRTEGARVAAAIETEVQGAVVVGDGAEDGLVQTEPCASYIIITPVLSTRQAIIA